MGGQATSVFHQAVQAMHLSLLPSVGREMRTGQSLVMLCGCGVSAIMAHSIVYKSVSGR